MNWRCFAFLCCVSILMGHEIDATYRREWRLLPLLRKMREEVAAAYWVILHVCLFLPVLALLAFPGAGFAGAGRMILCGFAIVHVGLHAFWPRSELYRFDNLLSWTLIGGAGLFGAVHLLCPG